MIVHKIHLTDYDSTFVLKFLVGFLKNPEEGWRIDRKFSLDFNALK